AAERDVIARGEGMDVEAVAGADIHGVAQHPFGAGEVPGPGDLDVLLLALDDGDVKPGGAGDLDVVGGGAGMVAVGGKDRVEVKSLRRLRAPEPGAPGDAGDAPLRAGPEGIGDGKGGCGGLGMVERARDAGDDGRRD